MFVGQKTRNGLVSENPPVCGSPTLNQCPQGFPNLSKHQFLHLYHGMWPPSHGFLRTDELMLGDVPLSQHMAGLQDGLVVVVILSSQLQLLEKLENSEL